MFFSVVIGAFGLLIPKMEAKASEMENVHIQNFTVTHDSENTYTITGVSLPDNPAYNHIYVGPPSDSMVGAGKTYANDEAAYSDFLTSYENMKVNNPVHIGDSALSLWLLSIQSISNGDSVTLSHVDRGIIVLVASEIDGIQYYPYSVGMTYNPSIGSSSTNQIIGALLPSNPSTNN